jgi:hypothetical protein
MKLKSTIRNGTYYIVIKHRNSIETWSTTGGLLFDKSNNTYDFTTSSSKAYGDNMLLKGTKWCIFSGDINQDGFVDGADMAPLDNDLYNYVSGWVVTDLTGDMFVDGADMAILDNNLYNYVGVMRPGGKDALKGDKEIRKQGDKN